MEKESSKESDREPSFAEPPVEEDKPTPPKEVEEDIESFGDESEEGEQEYVPHSS